MVAIVSGTHETRSESFGQGHQLTLLDKWGAWLSNRKLRRAVSSFRGRAVADVGSGYNASLTRTIVDDVRKAVVTDVALADDLKHVEKIVAIEGTLPESLRGVAAESIDIVLCNNVIEHLWEPLATLMECRRILAPTGLLFVNVPSW